MRAATPVVAQEADPKDAEKEADYCTVKAQELAGECASFDDEKEEARCEERVAELCDECPEADVCGPATTILTGALASGDPTFARCGISGGSYYYNAFSYTHGGGPLSIGVRGTDTGGGTLEDPDLYVYSSFNPADPCANRVAQDNHSGCGVDAYLPPTVLPAGTYTIVVTSSFSTIFTFPGLATGSYTLEINPPPPPC